MAGYAGYGSSKPAGVRASGTSGNKGASSTTKPPASIASSGAGSPDLKVQQQQQAQHQILTMVQEAEMELAAARSIRMQAEVERAHATGEVMVGIQPLDVSPAKTTQRPAAALDDVIGLHEGLTVVVKSAVEKLRAPGAFSRSSALGIPFPLLHVEDQFHEHGASDQLNKFVSLLNQAAENGVDSTMAVLSASIEQIPKDLVLSILGGSLDCGTLYLQDQCTQQLKDELTDSFEFQLDEIGALKQWNALKKFATEHPQIDAQHNLELQEVDVATYALQWMVVGLFVVMAQKEQSLRKEPASMTKDELVIETFTKYLASSSRPGPDRSAPVLRSGRGSV